MFLIELLLPVSDKRGVRFNHGLHAETRDELVARFGGLTAHSLTPARGLWENEEGHVIRDDIVIFEVLVERIERTWWTEYRKVLERRFDQSALLIRANEVVLL